MPVNITDNTDIKLIKDLIEQINNDLGKKTSSIVPLLNKVARLASLVEDEVMLRLFEMHLEGIDKRGNESPDFSRYSFFRSPPSKAVELFLLDRNIEESDLTLSPESVEELEIQLNDLDDLYDPRIQSAKESLVTVLRNIKHRVGSFAREAERYVSVTHKPEAQMSPISSGRKVFIGHGRSAVWKDLKDFIKDDLGLEHDEFNREEQAGNTTIARLEEMLNNASIAFLIMTAEDEHADKSFHARENVIHELGLFQGKLGFKKAIVLLEEGCHEFSNIYGLTEIRFPKNDILARSERIRKVLKREGILIDVKGLVENSINN